MTKLVITINGDELDGHDWQEVIGSITDTLPNRGEAVFELGDGGDLYDGNSDTIGEWTVTL